MVSLEAPYGEEIKVRRLLGTWSRSSLPEFSSTHAHEFITGDLRDVDFVKRVLEFKDQGLP